MSTPHHRRPTSRRERRAAEKASRRAAYLGENFLDLSAREKKEWMGLMLQGVRPTPDDAEASDDGPAARGLLRQWWNRRRAVRARKREARGPSLVGRLRGRFERFDPQVNLHAIAGQEELHAGDPAEALRHFEALVDIYTRTSGPSSERTLIWTAFCAKAQAALGNIDEALALQSHVIAERTATLGPDHPDTLRIRGQLGQTLTRNGRPEDGLEQQEALHRDKLRVLGARHPSTLDTLGNLAEALLICQFADQAVDAYEQLLALRTEVLGADHPDTTRTASNLAAARSRTGDPRALDDLVHNLETVLKREGPDSLEALAARGYLAEYHLTHGDGNAALAVLVPLAEDRRELLGPDHADTLRAERMIIEAIDLLGDTVRATVELDDLITRLVVALGPQHPSTTHARLLQLQIRADLGQVEPAEVAAFAREVAGRFEPAHEIHEIVRSVGEQVAERHQRGPEDPPTDAGRA